MTEGTEEYVVWCPTPWPPKRHQHIGHLRWDAMYVFCEGCGQEWNLEAPTQEYNRHRFTAHIKKHTKTKKPKTQKNKNRRWNA